MGVQGLWKLLECSGRPINPETLEGKILGVDISIWLNQAVKGARDRHGNAIQNAHLLTLFHRLCKLLFFRVRPIFVFDGEAPLLKKQTLAKRRQKKDVAASEAKKTNEKLLRTFLKRQAIKAALSGNQQSNEGFPSLSHISRKEEDDTYALPQLEDKDQNSSEEEEEREWEERMSHKRILQEELFANPSSVDIDSEEFSNLPPEVKHEILTDMKEFTKRRRTLFEAMPEDSNDFSQYQLKGLLKKNNLNRCLDNVRKEMSQLYTGEVRAQLETEGGFLKEVESCRLVSEDMSHYILIKGIQSKEDKKEDYPEENMPSSSSEIMPKTYLDLKLASAHKSKKTNETVPDAALSVPDAAPASPRTLRAIQEAMLENASDDDHVTSVPQYSQITHVPVGAVDGSVSPRTLHAIHQALAEDELVSDKRPAKKRDGNNELFMDQPKLIITSSDDEDHVLISGGDDVRTIPIFAANSEARPSLTLASPSSEKDKSLVSCSVPCSKQDESPHALDASKVERRSVNKQVVKRNLFQSQCTVPVIPSPALESNKVCAYKHNSDTEASKLKSSNEPDVKLTPDKETIVTSSTSIATSTFAPPAISVSATLFTDNKSLCKGTKECNIPAALNRVHQDVFAPTEDNADCKQPASIYIPDLYVPMTPESISVSEAESGQDKGMDSDSDGTFIDVDSNLENSNNSKSALAQEVENAVALEPVPVEKATVPIVTASSTRIPTEHSFGEDKSIHDQVSELHHQEEPGDGTADNEWQDINVEELELLDNNLFVQQTSLQAQRQQQERVATSVTGQMYLESQELLRLFGIPFLVAPMEAEAQCAILDLTDQTSGTITDDSDIWLFGARHVYKNFFSQNKYVEYYQFSDIQNQLGLDRSKLINLAYLMGSDYTDGIPSVGYVSAMEILNEFTGLGLEPLMKFKEWWSEAQKNKTVRPNPHDTKVKKKLRVLELHPGFPNPAVADAYLKPVIDESKSAFSWGRPDLEQIREFCESHFGWFRSKTDELLLPVLKQLNAQQTQLRIDSFFHVEQHEAHTLKSQRLRRAVTCMKRKERENEGTKATDLTEKEYATGVQKNTKSNRKNTKSKKGKSQSNAELDNLDPVRVEGGFIGSEMKSLSPKKENSSSDTDTAAENTNKSADTQKRACKYSAATKRKAEESETSSSSEDEKEVVLVAAKPVFQGNKKKPRTERGRKKR